ncbi:glycosyl transferase, group 2 family protein [Cryptosporidium serpentis]
MKIPIKNSYNFSLAYSKLICRFLACSLGIILASLSISKPLAGVCFAAEVAIFDYFTNYLGIPSKKKLYRDREKKKKSAVREKIGAYKWVGLLVVLLCELSTFLALNTFFFSQVKRNNVHDIIPEQLYKNSTTFNKFLTLKYDKIPYLMGLPTTGVDSELIEWLTRNWKPRTIENLPYWDSRVSLTLRDLNAQLEIIHYTEINFDTYVDASSVEQNINGAVTSRVIIDDGAWNNQRIGSNHSLRDYIVSEYAGESFGKNDLISIVIPVYNEEEYIVKTICYTIETMPIELLGEIVVVDDASRIPIVKILEEQLPNEYKKYVRVIRFKKNEGLIRAKIVGADASFGPNIFFLDGHCRPKPGWSQSLVRSIRQNYKRIVCPIVQNLYSHNWSDVGTAGAKMMIEWSFAFHWYDDGLDEVPIASGGILMITKRWWEESGKYDPGMMYWGGENIEQSFRVWMCGGEIHVIRDSLVGHIFNRTNTDERDNNLEYKTLLIRNVHMNHKRTAYVWLDYFYYQTYFKNFHMLSYETSLIGSGIDERLAIRQNLQCKSFEWYIKKFKPSLERQGEMYLDYHHIQHSKSKLCLTTRLTMIEPRNMTVNSIPKALIPRTVVPADISKYGDKFTDEYDDVTLDICDPFNYNQQWLFILGNRMLYNRSTKRCLDRANIDLESHGKNVIAKGEDVNKQANMKQIPLITVECDWNLVMRSKNMNQFWAWKPEKILNRESSEYGRIVTWDGDEHRTNQTGGAEEFFVSLNKGINENSLCAFSIKNIGCYNQSTLYYTYCTEIDKEKFLFRKMWLQKDLLEYS